MLKDFDFSKINYIFSTVPIAFKVPVPIVQIGLFLETNDIINVNFIRTTLKIKILKMFFF